MNPDTRTRSHRSTHSRGLLIAWIAVVLWNCIAFNCAKEIPGAGYFYLEHRSKPYDAAVFGFAAAGGAALSVVSIWSVRRLRRNVRASK